MYETKRLFYDLEVISPVTLTLTRGNVAKWSARQRDSQSGGPGF